MMISTEGYYNMELAGKTAEKIAVKIRGLKRTISQLKHTMEQPDYAPTMCPTEEVRLSCTRDYLARAIEAYTAAGGKYILSKAELRAAEFDNDVEYITTITFSIGGFFGGYETRTLTVSDNDVYMDLSLSLAPISEGEPTPEWFDKKEEFIAAFRNLHIEEWKHNYNNPYVLDGTQWEMKIEFGNGRKAILFCGSNAYPYNFGKLCDLVGYEKAADDDE